VLTQQLFVIHGLRKKIFINRLGNIQNHCIDFAIIGREQMWRCRDVRVMCGAECNTDHKLLRMKLIRKTIAET